MIVIYTQDKTYIKRDAEDARTVLNEVYGNKLGIEAYNAIKDGRDGTAYRKNGGPLIQVVSREKADQIREKEIVIEMM